MNSKLFNNRECICTYKFNYSKKFSYILYNQGHLEELLTGFRENVRSSLCNEQGEFVYIYFLEDKVIEITKTDNFAYIGKSKSISQKTFERFMHEIYADNSGNDNAKQYTLTHFYENGIKMRLEVFFVEDCCKVEKELLHAHKIIFGYLPIANGKDG